MPNPTFAFALFLSSYSPAFLILAVRAIDRSWVLCFVALGVAVFSAGAFLLYIRVARYGGPFRAIVEEIEPRDADLAAYVASYLLPFVVVFGATAQDVAALALFLAFIGLLWINSRAVYLNPLLAIARYHIFIVRVRAVGTGPGGTLGRNFLLSQKHDLRVGDEVRPDRLASGVLIDLSARS